MRLRTWHVTDFGYGPGVLRTNLRTWCVTDEVADELGELEADVEQRRQLLVRLALEVLPRAVDILDERRRQRVRLLVQNAARTETRTRKHNKIGQNFSLDFVSAGNSVVKFFTRNGSRPCDSELLDSSARGRWTEGSERCDARGTSHSLTLICIFGTK